MCVCVYELKLISLVSFYFALFNVATGKFDITYVVHICSSPHTAIGQHWIRIPELQLKANGKKNPLQNNNHYAQSRQHGGVSEE